MENNLGALWIKQGKNGEFYKGYIELESGEKLNVVVFKNTYKKADNQPDYRILKATQKEEEQKVEQANNDDDLPF